MNKKPTLAILTALLIFTLVGCSSATPTALPLPTQPPQVVTVVITATPPPATATPAQPTMTPVPTVALTTTVSATSAATKAASSSSASTKPVVVASRTPTKVVVLPTATNIPIKFGAPGLVKPLWQPPWNDGQKDEVKFPGSAMVFNWKAVGGLNGDECYLLSLTTEAINGNLAPRSDNFVIKCGDQTRQDYTIEFVLFQPGRGSPSYSSLMMDISEMWIYWTVTVVKNLGTCADEIHCKTAPLSPASYKGRFLFKGG